MTDAQLAEIEARLRAARAVYGQVSMTDHLLVCKTFNDYAPTDIAALISALKERDAEIAQLKTKLADAQCDADRACPDHCEWRCPNHG